MLCKLCSSCSHTAESSTYCCIHQRSPQLRTENSLDQVEDRDSVADWAKDTVAIWSEEDVSLSIDSAAEVLEDEVCLHIECKRYGQQNFWVGFPSEIREAK